jgi:predicted TIM-barrel fold metal-dependent hydrolase
MFSLRFGSNRFFPCSFGARTTSWIAFFAGFAFFGMSLPAEEPPENLDIYLLIGQSNMAGRAPIPEEARGPIERCWLLNAEGEWEPARNPLNIHSTIRKGEDMQRLSPGYRFAQRMLEADPDKQIGLIVNARGGTKIEQWLGKSKYYWGIRGRAKAFVGTGQLKGVLWHQGESNSGDPENYLADLKTFITRLRGDLKESNLPFVAGQVADTPPSPINQEIAKLPDHVHLTAVASSEGLTTYDRWHFDTESQLRLGERYAEAMRDLQEARAKIPEFTPPRDLQPIDVHVHAHAVDPEGLERVAKWMDMRNIEKCIVSPLDHKGSRAYTEAEREQMLANYKRYEGRIYRMALIEPGDYATAEEAAAVLRREKQDGAIAMGEHYGKGLMFDDPKNLLLYEASGMVDFPVMFHIDQNKNMVTPGMPEVDRVLKKFPHVKVVAHAYWWRRYADGTCDRQLSEFPNLYADMSGQVVINQINRDRDKAREFLIKHQDRILWGTDEGWWSFDQSKEDIGPHYTILEELDLPDEVRYKIYRGNAKKVYGLNE